MSIDITTVGADVASRSIMFPSYVPYKGQAVLYSSRLRFRSTLQSRNCREVLVTLERLISSMSSWFLFLFSASYGLRMNFTAVMCKRVHFAVSATVSRHIVWQSCPRGRYIVLT